MSDEIEIARLISLSKKSFPPIESHFYKQLRKKIAELDAMMESAEKEGDDAEKQEAEREKENIKNYAQKIYNKRIRSLIVQLSKKVTGGKTDLSRFTEEEKVLFQKIYDMVEEHRRELMEGKIDIIHEGKFEILEEETEPVEERGKIQEKGDEREELNPEKPEMDVRETGEKEKIENEVKKPEMQKKSKKDREVLIPVRMLMDEAFVGLDGHYYYSKKGDVLNLPEKIASILLKGKYAERIG